ncbi:MAG: type II toxin-antitoxin system Phd/YefM family antitoxin [Kiritimatiellia bacterium]
MKKTNISYLKKQLSSCLKEVREGEEYIILDRKTPVAVLRPYGTLAGDGDRERLVSEGLLRPASRPHDPEVLGSPVSLPGSDLSSWIDQDREGR